MGRPRLWRGTPHVFATPLYLSVFLWVGMSLGCTTIYPEPGAGRGPRVIEPAAILQHTALAPELAKLEPGPLTVESSMLLRLYTWFHAKNYTPWRIEFPSEDDAPPVVAHWLIPSGPGPHATVVVFPILGGSHVVSELLAKTLVNQGLAVARLERHPLDLENAEGPEVLAETLAGAVRDARRLIDFLETRPEVDRSRIAAAGASMGGILACLLHSVDPRVRAGFFMLAGGGLAEILYDSTENSVRNYRNRMFEQAGSEDRAEFLAWVRPFTEAVDPLRYAASVDASSVYLASGRFDRVMPPARTEALWEALGRPEWMRVPVGHYQSLPFLFWIVSNAVDHLERVLAE